MVLLFLKHNICLVFLHLLPPCAQSLIVMLQVNSLCPKMSSKEELQLCWLELSLAMYLTAD